MTYLYLNDKANNNDAITKLKPQIEKLEKKWNEKIIVSSTDCSWDQEFLKFKNDDRVILAGGDGTINYFINNANLETINFNLYALAVGSGNDFFNDQKDNIDEDGLVFLNDKIKHLPTIEVNGKKYHFINGIGYGIDGDCCVKADELKAKGVKKINYTKITVGLLFKTFKPKNATVEIDGETFYFKKSYLASSMLGKFYGGGMMVAPEQKREDNILSFVCFHGKGKLRTLTMFPKIFTGKHLKYKKNFFVKKGKNIIVSFDKPCGLQIDGEVVKDVLTYRAYID